MPSARSAASLEPAHEAQLLNYLRGSTLEVGLLLNFGPRASFRRLIYTNDRKRALRDLATTGAMPVEPIEVAPVTAG